MAQSVSATRRISRLRRHTRLRKKLSGTAERPRLVVHRSARHIHVQLVNDLNGTTVAAASSIEADVRGVPGDKKARSVRVGQRGDSSAVGIPAAVEYHGVDAGGFGPLGDQLADAARENGLSF
ncbi:50S ribosomal protein L18 [Mycobacterium tuberculosis]|nr:50S ribosomal protein L18 [Mycobacterium tuberculosis]